MVESRTAGTVWFVSVLSFWLYYTLWILVSPFIDTSHSFQRYFPDRKWGIVIPILLGVGYLSVALTFVGLALISDSKIYERVSQKKATPSNGCSSSETKDTTGESVKPSYKFKRFIESATISDKEE